MTRNNTVGTDLSASNVAVDLRQEPMPVVRSSQQDLSKDESKMGYVVCDIDGKLEWVPRAELSMVECFGDNEDERWYAIEYYRQGKMVKRSLELHLKKGLEHTIAFT
jgi:hypothetical protein